MGTLQKESKPVGPAAAICLGILCCVLAAFIFWSGISGLMAGKTYTMGKGAHDLIVEQDTPKQFWFWIAAYFVVAIIAITGGVLILISGFKRVR